MVSAGSKLSFLRLPKQLEHPIITGASLDLRAISGEDPVEATITYIGVFISYSAEEQQLVWDRFVRLCEHREREEFSLPCL
ncbi:hypothetical protein AGR4A_pAt30106 [Agrobacterium tumefaciens str. B6]|uniref:Uncharacterized protein n=1 Tax=Agrobacterium tumefaciens str. B6 TaxID=1183423 RepID=A0A822VD17_AGRTU|nr:hypothetical protein AGR4A_pAt30106 [Agrobacterium tumefaciens str. B6]